MRGSKFLAVERGAFDAETTQNPHPEPITTAATATLAELAAHHDQQPTDVWLGCLRKWLA